MQRLGNGAEVSQRRTASSPVTRPSSAAEELGTSLPTAVATPARLETACSLKPERAAKRAVAKELRTLILRSSSSLLGGRWSRSEGRQWRT
jgi:hypothetical protein